MIKLPETEGLHDKGRLGDPAGPGPRLRAAREACGYDIQDIAKQLRLHPHIIEDLERDQFSDHLALVFVRGYLRAYAGLIGLDPEDVVAEFNALGYEEARDLPDLKTKPQSGSRMRSQDMYKSGSRAGVRWAAAGLITVALGGLFIAYNYQPQEQIYPAPVLSDVNDANAPAPGTDPNLPPAPPADSNATAVTPDLTATPATATPAAATAAPASAPTPVPAAAAPAAPRPVVRAPSPMPPSEDDEDLQLPAPGSDD